MTFAPQTRLLVTTPCLHATCPECAINRTIISVQNAIIDEQISENTFSINRNVSMDDKQVTVLRYIAFLAGFLHYPGFKFNAVCSNTGCIYTDPSMYKV